MSTPLAINLVDVGPRRESSDPTIPQKMNKPSLNVEYRRIFVDFTFADLTRFLYKKPDPSGPKKSSLQISEKNFVQETKNLQLLFKFNVKIVNTRQSKETRWTRFRLKQGRDFK